MLEPSNNLLRITHPVMPVEVLLFVYSISSYRRPAVASHKSQFFDSTLIKQNFQIPLRTSPPTMHHHSTFNQDQRQLCRVYDLEPIALAILVSRNSPSDIYNASSKKSPIC
ncbi:hypothetical protein ABKN59_006329 [Abortiporus biennis]